MELLISLKQSNLSSLFNDLEKSFEIIITNNKKIPVIVPLNVSTSEGSSVIWNDISEKLGRYQNKTPKIRHIISLSYWSIF
ncbi:unnamed protein product [Rhizophagus irregularis]|nr:unnamed protein product [Rhizophagus irregularis]